MELKNILKELERNRRYFPRKAVEAAVEQREAITPGLLQWLEESIARADSLIEEIEEEFFFGHMYALYLLAQFRETRAHAHVVQLARLPEQQLDALVGDFLTEDLGRVLASTCGGDISQIQSLIEDSSVYEYARGAALESLKILVAEGDLPRDEAMQYFKHLLREGLERFPSHAWDNLVSCATRLHPEEVYEHIRGAYEEGLVDPGFIRLESVEKVIKIDRDKVLGHLAESTPGYIRDTVKELQNWHCFKPQKPLEHPEMQPPVVSQTPNHRASVQPNEPCPCGSGKKYKKCCGKM